MRQSYNITSSTRKVRAYKNDLADVGQLRCIEFEQPAISFYAEYEAEYAKFY